MNRILIGESVRLPNNFTFRRRRFFVSSYNKRWGYTLRFRGGKEKGTTIQYFDEKEVIYQGGCFELASLYPKINPVVYAAFLITYFQGIL